MRDTPKAASIPAPKPGDSGDSRGDSEVDSDAVPLPDLRRALVIESDDLIAKPLGWFLKQEGYLVAQAATATEALAQLAQHSFALILLDLHLPDRERNGLALFEAIKLRIEVPVILLAGSPADMEAVIDQRPGFVAVLTKPFRKEQLLQALRSTVGPAFHLGFSTAAPVVFESADFPETASDPTIDSLSA